MATKTSLIKKSLTSLGFVCKVRQERYCMYVFLTKADRADAAKMASVDFLLRGIGMLPSNAPGVVIPADRFHVSPIYED